ncbi:hypothetical protein KR018_001529 [Drosophila ironensis]|nr:hypothetical protein KR018_001529 [Drosophila ironensis]
MLTGKIRSSTVSKIFNFRRNPQRDQQQNQQTEDMQDVPNFLPTQMENVDLQAPVEPSQMSSPQRLVGGEAMLQTEVEMIRNTLPPPRRLNLSQRNQLQPSPIRNCFTAVKVLLAVLTVCVILATIPLYLRQNAMTQSKVILLWNDDIMDHEGSAHSECGCVVTNNRNYSRIDAVVFNGDTPYTINGFSEINSSPECLVVYAARKPLSKAQDPLNSSVYINFNMTMTYRRDSQLVWSDYYFSYKNLVRRLSGLPNASANYNFEDMKGQTARQIEAALAVKERLAVYLMYDVNDDTLAESKYLEKLRRYERLDAVASCGPPHDCRSYHFMLIFETSACPDYVPPQMYMAMHELIVPVLIGGGNLKNLVPEHSYIDSRDFHDPLDLIKYLYFLSRKPEEYATYFWWHALYMVRRTVQPYCALCNFLQSTPQYDGSDGSELLTTKDVTKFSLKDWWKKRQCPLPITTFLNELVKRKA